MCSRSWRRSRQRFQDREVVSTVYRQQASRKTPLGPRPGILDRLAAQFGQFAGAVGHDRLSTCNELLDFIFTAGVVNVGVQIGAQRLDRLPWVLAAVVGRWVRKSSKKMLWPCDRCRRRCISGRGKEMDECAGQLPATHRQRFLVFVAISSMPRAPWCSGFSACRMIMIFWAGILSLPTRSVGVKHSVC